MNAQSHSLTDAPLLLIFLHVARRWKLCFLLSRDAPLLSKYNTPVLKGKLSIQEQNAQEKRVQNVRFLLPDMMY